MKVRWPDGLITPHDVWHLTTTKPLVALLYLSLGALVGIILQSCIG